MDMRGKVMVGKDDMVNIFDYEDKDLTNDITEQADYHRHWLQSLSAGS
mgnify:CR=1 FL=1